ncbi:hypothetical protein [Catellatospora citrea]|uniref:Uncharacterized protein n=1 Tax=Catellatospora citrea TaxID=53366 RepID=A0A8J3KC45_9ACTN|nr:hypothetical protein [Catellatospora citrea]RKE06138.1 hypothetical protein C8E86_0957 [Catellatospora citrea]GIG00477.1 hypothetical protein Cci01nite_55700 [Catellatospora citrea]
MTASPLRHAAPGTDVARTRTLARPHRAAVAGVLALALLGTAACGKKDEPQASASANTVITESPGASASALPSGSAAATPQPSSTGGSGNGSGNQTPTFPKSAKDYGLAALAAWASGSKSKLDQYAVQAAVAQFMGHGKPNSQWSNLNCEAAGSGRTACNYRNAHGDDARLTMEDTQLGHPTATVDVFLNRTQYPTDAAGYVGFFMAAWGDGNKQRMTRYASSSIANMFTGKTPPTGSQTNATQSGSTWTVQVNGLPVGSGNWTFTVNGSKLGGGNAITAAKID